MKLINLISHVFFSYRASLDTLKIIVPDNEIIQPENHAELLNGSLVYLCHTIDESNTQVCCYGIGEKIKTFHFFHDKHVILMTTIYCRSCTSN